MPKFTGDFPKKKIYLTSAFSFFSSIVSFPTHKLHNFTTDKLTFTMKGNEIPRKSILFPFQIKFGFKFHHLMLREINVCISYYILTYCTVTTIFTVLWQVNDEVPIFLTTKDNTTAIAIYTTTSTKDNTKTITKSAHQKIKNHSSCFPPPKTQPTKHYHQRTRSDNGEPIKQTTRERALKVETPTFTTNRERERERERFESWNTHLHCNGNSRIFFRMVIKKI